MFAAITRLFGSTLLGLCLFSLTFFLLSAAVLLRLLPRALPSIVRLLRGLLAVSYSFYAFLLARIAPAVQGEFGIDLLAGFPRVVATMTMSLFIAVLIHLVAGLQPSAWIFGLFALHGLFVGLAWDGIVNDEARFRLGERLE